LTCGQNFALYVALYIGFLDRIVVDKDSNTFLVCIELYLVKIQKKSGRGEMWFQMIILTGLITSSGQVNLLSGRIRRYRVGVRSGTWCTPVNPLGRGAGRLGSVGHAHAVRQAGLRRIRPDADFQLRKSLPFSNLFCKLQIKFEFH
jgi:hypothetical protein